MKKLLRILLCLILVLSMVMSLTACPQPEPPPELTRKEKVIKLFEELSEEPELTEINAYHSDYDAMVAYLKEKGVIGADAQPVDMNTTAGYVKKYDGTYDDVKEIADKAYDYDGIWLVWYDLADLDAATSKKTAYDSLISASTIVIGGGMYTLALGEGVVNGSYALMYGSEITQEEKTAKNAIFEAIDNTPLSLTYMTIMDVAKALKEAGLIENVINFVNLNEKYSFNTFSVAWDSTEAKYVATASVGNVKVADNAQDYDGIVIYYYALGNTSKSMSDYYKALKANGSYDMDFSYYATADEAVLWKTVTKRYKFNEENEYNAEGTQLNIKVDAVFGRFGVTIND